MVDIICFDLTQKMPFQLKRGPMTEAIKKGIMFEINYSDALEGTFIYQYCFIFNKINHQEEWCSQMPFSWLTQQKIKIF